MEAKKIDSSHQREYYAAVTQVTFQLFSNMQCQNTNRMNRELFSSNSINHIFFLLQLAHTKRTMHHDKLLLRYGVDSCTGDKTP